MSQIEKIRDGLSRLGSTIETIANTQTPAVPEATVNSISGNAVHGGKITLLRSTGIRDQATRTSLLVEDDQITVGTADVGNILGSLNVENDMDYLAWPPEFQFKSEFLIQMGPQLIFQ